MRKTSFVLTLLASLVASVVPKLLGMWLLRSTPMPTIQLTMPNGTPFPKFEAPNLGFPSGRPLQFPNPLGAPPTAWTPPFPIARAEPARPARRKSGTTVSADRGAVDHYQPGGPHVIRPTRAPRAAGSTGESR